jgi:hypothetical protein
MPTGNKFLGQVDGKATSHAKDKKGDKATCSSAAAKANSESGKGKPEVDTEVPLTWANEKFLEVLRAMFNKGRNSNLPTFVAMDKGVKPSMYVGEIAFVVWQVRM